MNRFFVHFAFYISKTCSWLNLGELGSKIQFWNRKSKLCKKSLWRPDSLINCSLALTLSDLLKPSCSQPSNRRVYEVGLKIGLFLYQTQEEPQNLEVLGYSAEFLLQSNSAEEMVLAQPWLLCVILLGWCCPALLGCHIWRGCVEVYMLAPQVAVGDLTVHLRLSQAVLHPLDCL